jgi:hypothetical protein
MKFCFEIQRIPNGKKAALIVFVYLFICSITAIGQTSPKDTLRVLFVGNSYTYVGNMPQIVSILASSRNIPLAARKSVEGGMSLKDHWLGHRGLMTKTSIAEGHFDFVVLQDQSQAPIEFPDTTLKYAQLFCDYIREFGASPVFYETWARERIPQQQETLHAIYLRAAQENSAKLVPVGKAWELARKLRPEIELFGPDGSHPANLGVYLTSCMFFTFLTDENPENLISDIYTTDKEGEMLYLLWVDKEDAVFLQKVAVDLLDNE